MRFLVSSAKTLWLEEQSHGCMGVRQIRRFCLPPRLSFVAATFCKIDTSRRTLDYLAALLNKTLRFEGFHNWKPPCSTGTSEFIDEPPWCFVFRSCSAPQQRISFPLFLCFLVLPWVGSWRYTQDWCYGHCSARDCPQNLLQTPRVLNRGSWSFIAYPIYSLVNYSVAKQTRVLVTAQSGHAEPKWQAFVFFSASPCNQVQHVGVGTFIFIVYGYWVCHI